MSCPTCKGRGVISSGIRRGDHYYPQTCPSCGGAGNLSSSGAGFGPRELFWLLLALAGLGWLAVSIVPDIVKWVLANRELYSVLQSSTGRFSLILTAWIILFLLAKHRRTLLGFIGGCFGFALCCGATGVLVTFAKFEDWSGWWPAAFVGLLVVLLCLERQLACKYSIPVSCGITVLFLCVGLSGSVLLSGVRSFLTQYKHEDVLTVHAQLGDQFHICSVILPASVLIASLLHRDQLTEQATKFRIQLFLTPLLLVLLVTSLTYLTSNLLLADTDLTEAWQSRIFRQLVMLALLSLSAAKVWSRRFAIGLAGGAVGILISKVFVGLAREMIPVDVASEWWPVPFAALVIFTICCNSSIGRTHWPLTGLFLVLTAFCGTLFLATLFDPLQMSIGPWDVSAFSEDPNRELGYAAVPGAAIIIASLYHNHQTETRSRSPKMLFYFPLLLFSIVPIGSYLTSFLVLGSNDFQSQYLSHSARMILIIACLAVLAGHLWNRPFAIGLAGGVVSALFAIGIIGLMSRAIPDRNLGWWLLLYPVALVCLLYCAVSLGREGWYVAIVLIVLLSVAVVALSMSMFDRSTIKSFVPKSLVDPLQEMSLAVYGIALLIFAATYSRRWPKPRLCTTAALLFGGQPVLTYLCVFPLLE